MDDKMDMRLSGFDFSTLSPVREPLLQKLLSLHRSQKAIACGNEDLWAKRMDDEALDEVADEVAAAGNPLTIKKPKSEK